MRLFLLIMSAAFAGAAPVDFDRQVRPIFESRCYECHGEKKQKSGIRLDRKESVFQGGDSGKPLVAAGKSGESSLIQRVTTNDPDEVMPPKGERLTAEQISLLKTWIDEGATWPQDTSQKKTHWAYLKPVRPALPKVKGPWPVNGIDNFVLARLEREGLRPADAADRAVLLRRVSLDLIGLPPTLEEVDLLMKDNSARAYENAVDRLLNSPHYGERWARPWLDLARYADTQGFEKDSRRTMWPYRDWVIKALNDNLPFDQFTIEQMAGDMLPDATQDQKVATGFHRNTMTNTEGGTDNEEFRHDAIIDRINTTMSVWMGTTFACAQCHNHKYDPITAKDYYNFYAFLNHTADADYDDEKPTMKVFQPGQEQKLADLRERVKAAETNLSKTEIAGAQAVWEVAALGALTNWQVLDPMTWSSKGGATFTKTESKSLLASGENPPSDVYVVAAKADAQRITGFRLEVLETSDEKVLGRASNGSFVLSKFEAEAGSKPIKLKTVTADYAQEAYSATNLLAGTGNGWAIGAFDKNLRVRRSAYFALDQPLEVPGTENLKFTLRHSSKFPDANIARFRLYATSAEDFQTVAQVPAEVRTILLASPEKRDDKQRAKLREHYMSIAPELAGWRESLAQTKAAEKIFFDALPITAVMEELSQPRETYFRVRGAYLSKGDKVRPGTPAILHAFNSAYPSNRLGLARWLVDTNNPLTARVIVNRFWEQYFGRGIMETVEDFGTQSEPPSHPELLDWLAMEFMDSGWDMKAMHKLIVMSATYRQSSKAPPELHQRDPYNRLYARGPRIRLEAEMIRDQALVVSGLLSRKLGGPSVMPPQPEGLWQVVYSGDKWETSKGEDKYRRALYTFWRRTIPHPAMTTFDAPSREFCVLRRSRSNTPLQALTTLNDAAYIEAAQALALRVLLHECQDVKARAEFAFRLCLIRKPSAAEVERLTKLFESELAHYRSAPKAAEKMAGRPGDVAELAAWTVVGNVLLNLDEMITKG